MLNLLTNRKEANKIGSLEVDVTVSENHEYKNSVTRYTIEEGFDITDHIHQEPEKLTISGIFSETPMPYRVSLIRSLGSESESYTYNAMEILLGIAGYLLPKQEKVTGIIERQIDPTNTLVTPENKTNPKIVDLVTGLRVYTNMVCTSLTFPVDKTTGQSLSFTMEFIKIYTVESKITTLNKSDDLKGKAPNVKNSSPKTVDIGNQTVKKPRSESILVSIVDYFGR